MTIDFSTVMTFSNGISVLNCTPHELVFRDGEVDVIVEPCGATLKAAAVESPAGTFGAARLVRTEFRQTQEGLQELGEIKAKVPNVLVIGSIVSAQAYPGAVVGMVLLPGFERVVPAEKRMTTEKFVIY